ncbi:hypothetical protein Ancab_024983 [Ancistrocladus abbreviatus]
MVKYGEQVNRAASSGNSRKLPGDTAGPLCGFELVFDVVCLLEACGTNPPSKPDEACGPASQKFYSLNMLKKSKRRASSKRKSYRMRGGASVGLSAVGGEEGASILASLVVMKGLILLRELDSIVPASRAVMKGPISPRKLDNEVAKQIWELGKDLGAIFAGEDSEVMNHIKEMEARDRTAWEKS